MADGNHWVGTVLAVADPDSACDVGQSTRSLSSPSVYFIAPFSFFRLLGMNFCLLPVSKSAFQVFPGSSFTVFFLNLLLSLLLSLFLSLLSLLAVFLPSTKHPNKMVRNKNADRLKQCYQT